MTPKPIPDRLVSAQHSPRPQEAASSIRGRTLIVDDDPSIRALILAICRVGGRPAVAVESAEEALALLETEHFPVALIDRLLPGINGLELCRLWRQRPNGEDSYLLVISAMAEGPDPTAILGAGADDFASKPLAPSTLESRLEIAWRHAGSRAARAREKRLRRGLGHISAALTAATGLEEFLKAVHAEVALLLDAENFCVALREEKLGMWELPYDVDVGETSAPSEPIDLDRGLTGLVFRRASTVRVDAFEIRRLIDSGEIARVGAPEIAWMGAPLRGPEGVFGVLSVQSYSQGALYDETDEETFATIADGLALAIARKRAEEALRESEER